MLSKFGEARQSFSMSKVSMLRDLHVVCEIPKLKIPKNSTHTGIFVCLFVYVVRILLEIEKLVIYLFLVGFIFLKMKIFSWNPVYGDHERARHVMWRRARARGTIHVTTKLIMVGNFYGYVGRNWYS